jgi:uncharacterized membrane protein YidH (DUF202 family)
VLAWDRTAAALLINGALLIVRHLRSTGTGALVPAVLALVVILGVAVLGRRRARQLRAGDGRGPAAVWELVSVVAGVVAVGVLVVLAHAAVSL